MAEDAKEGLDSASTGLVIAILAVLLAGLAVGLWFILRPSETIEEGKALAELQEASEDVIESLVENPSILATDQPEDEIQALVDEATEEKAEVASDELVLAVTAQVEALPEAIETEVEVLVASSPEGPAPTFEEAASELVVAALDELATSGSLPVGNRPALNKLTQAVAENAVAAVGGERLLARPTSEEVDEFERDFARSLAVQIELFGSQAARQAAEAAKSSLPERDLDELGSVPQGPVDGPGETAGAIGMSGLAGSMVLLLVQQLLKVLLPGAGPAGVNVTVSGPIRVVVTSNLRGAGKSDPKKKA